MEDTKDFILHKDRGQKLSPMNQENPGPGHGHAKIRQELAATVPGQSPFAKFQEKTLSTVIYVLCNLLCPWPFKIQHEYYSPMTMSADLLGF